MKDLNWDRKGIKIGEKFLNNLRFADDIVLFSTTSKQLEDMLNELCKVSNSIGLQLNISKTKVATNSIQNPIILNQKPIEYVDKYIYLGKQISFKNTMHIDELDRRLNQTWRKYWSFKEILKSKLPTKLKKKVMDSCLLPCLTYGAQTWVFNKTIKTKLRSCQRAMERGMLGIKIMEKRKSSDIRQITKIIDAEKHAQHLKWNWAGHMARTTDRRWSKQVTMWKGPEGKRSRGRPKDRWVDDIQKTAGANWTELAQDREKWRRLEEAYTQDKGP
ncbi:hypothetical protein O3G_MSEX006933 [Manduca sexta]|uniref:Reverse transcriptase domain-containing protein n=1 Tax=Manduca sexta TaxID=7130 RepID=A0A921Z4D0_MANSE|nr:hypothetical protein O3G_MSEX006933 [Manduca sexta]